MTPSACEPCERTDISNGEVLPKKEVPDKRLEQTERHRHRHERGSTCRLQKRENNETMEAASHL